MAIAISNWDADPGGSNHTDFTTHDPTVGFAVDVVPSGGEALTKLQILVELADIYHLSHEVAVDMEPPAYALVANDRYSEGSAVYDPAEAFGDLVDPGSFDVTTLGGRFVIGPRDILGWVADLVLPGHTFTVTVNAWGDAGSYETDSKTFSNSDTVTASFTPIIIDQDPAQDSTVGPSDSISLTVQPAQTLGKFPIDYINVAVSIPSRGLWEYVYEWNGDGFLPGYSAGSSITDDTDGDGNISYILEIKRDGGWVGPFSISIGAGTSQYGVSTTADFSYDAALVDACECSEPATVTVVSPPAVSEQGWDISFNLSTNEWNLANNDFTLTTGGAAIKQEIELQLNTFVGEVVTDATRGTEWFEKVFTKPANVPVAENALRQRILGVPGVTAVNRVVMSFDGPTRVFSIEYDVSSDAGLLFGRVTKVGS